MDSAKELEEARYGDKGRCTSTATIHGAFGQDLVVRCTRSAWHKTKRGHVVRHGGGAFTRWPGLGSAVVEGTPWPDIPRDFVPGVGVRPLPA